MEISKDNSVVRKMLANMVANDRRRVEEEVETVDCDNIGMYRCRRSL